MNAQLTNRTLLAFAFTLLIPASLLAQSGTSSMSMSLSRAGVASYGPNGLYRMPTPDMIRVEEYINYHRHELPLPNGDARVHLDLQRMKLESGKTVLQVGLTTPRAMDPELVAPLNLVLVIDRSGSMSGDRIANVKQALRSFVERLRKQDKIAIVGFSSSAQVHLEATEKTKTRKIFQAIDSIQAGGSTNLHAGLMLGYQQAEANYDSERTNRVILLTDGRANAGEVDLDVIARKSKGFNQKGIDLSTVGLGHDLNHELLRRLADAGRGLIHFVDDAKDIQKTFVSEIDSLLAPAARKVKLTLNLGTATDSVKFYGYAPKRKGPSWTLKIDDLNHGATQVVMAKIPERELGPIVATLNYKDAITGENVERQVTSRKDTSLDNRHEISRNYSIALVADSIKRAAKLSNDDEAAKAEKRLSQGIRAAKKWPPTENDENVTRMLKIAKEYRQLLRDSLANSRECD